MLRHPFAVLWWAVFPRLPTRSAMLRVPPRRPRRPWLRRRRPPALPPTTTSYTHAHTPSGIAVAVGALRRFDGLFEAEWAKVQNMDFESSLETADTTDELPEAEKAELRASISKATGLGEDAFVETK